MAGPVVLDVVTFQVRTDGENHKMVVTTGPGLMRVDEPDDHFSIIYNPQTDHYTGLEHSNYTYWEFSWPEVRAAVQASKRYESYLQKATLDGFDNSASDSATNAEATSPAPAPEDSGYVWNQTQERKKIAGIDCIRWTGQTASGGNVEVWCSTGALPKVQAAMERLRTINEPVALVPVRILVPDFVFPVYDALVKAGVVPVVIISGEGQEKDRFSFVASQTHEGRSDLFAVPKLYIKTTLITMDGILNQNQDKKK